jgi:lia operon protein LiaG
MANRPHHPRQRSARMTALRHTLRLILVALLCAPLLASLGAQTERRSIAGDRVAIYNLAGRLRVQSGTGSDVVVEITRGGRDASRLTLATGSIRGAQTLRVVYPSDRIVYDDVNHRSRTTLRVSDDGTFDDGGDRDSFGRRRVEINDYGSGLDAHADLVVSIPKGQRAALHLGVGEATVTNVDGDLRVSVGAGRLVSEHTRGALSLDTGSGGLTLTDAQGNVTLDTGSGGVSINGVHGDALDIDAGSGSVRGADIDVKTLKVDVGSGGLRLDRVKAPRVEVDAGSGKTELELLTPVEHLSVDAGSGGVDLRLPAAQSAEIDIETGSGGIQSDFSVQTTHMERNHLRGKIGDGRGSIKIEAGSGGVRLIKS